ncbi:MAG TPA: O-antigen ligase family protein [Acidimicrobiales bacterium]|nr:O-antigen ligase family protein [Acidimicrobiales bacterium]
MRRISFGLVVLLVLSIPLEGVGSVGAAFKLPRLAAMAALGGVLLAVCAGAPVRPLHRMVGWAAAFTAWNGLSYFWSIDPDLTLSRSLTFLQLLVLVWVVWQEATTEERCVVLMKAYVAGAAVACAVSLVRGSDRFIERFALGDPNTFGVLTVIAFAIAAYLVHLEPRSFWGLACRPFMVVAAVAVVLTASRTATVALAVVCVVLLVDRRTVTLGRLALLAVAFVGFIVVAGRVVDSAQIERLQSIEAEVSEGTLGGRLPLWQLAWDRFTDRPVTGIGASTFRLEAEESLARGRAPHSTFVGILVELGTVGLVLFLAVLLSAARSAARLAPTLRRMWVAVALAWATASFSLSWETKKITWFLVSLVAAMAATQGAPRPEHDEVDRRPAPAP